MYDDELRYTSVKQGPLPVPLFYFVPQKNVQTASDSVPSGYRCNGETVQSRAIEAVEQIIKRHAPVS